MIFHGSRTPSTGVRTVAALGLALAASIVSAPAASAIGGGVESPDAYQFLGSLQRPESPRPDEHVCGTTLIAPQWMVTAGHCARTDEQKLVDYPRDWPVRIGSTSVTSGGEVIGVEKFIKHPRGASGGDVALLKLRTPAKSQPITIAENSPAPGDATRIMGWGMTCDQLEPACFPDRLREADTIVQQKAECGEERIDETEICVGSLDGKVGPTNMDSGGPAVVRAGDGWRLIGAVSGGSGGPDSYIYSDVHAFQSWLTDNMTEREPTLAGAAGLGGCSGSVVRADHSRPDDPALLLTNGHCVTGDRPAPGSAVLDRPEQREATVFGADGAPSANLDTTKLAYATMTGTDIALYELDRTYAELATEGVKVFALADGPVGQGDSTDLASGGLDTTWSCGVGGVVPELREEGYVQHDAVWYSEDCSPDSGASGSPLIDPHTEAVVGVHNTSNYFGEVCTANNPCEVDADGNMTVHKFRRYGQQTAAIPACLAAGSKLDLSRPDCTLTRPAA